jgi:site-specific recombinase XerD
VRPFHVAAWIEDFPGSKPTVKQKLAAVRMLYDFLVVRKITPSNPAHAVRGPKYVVKKGKTPVWSREDSKTLLDSILKDSVSGLRDRALIAAMLYSFARVSAVLKLKFDDYYHNGARRRLRLHEKGGKEKELPVHHKLEELLDEYLKATGSATSQTLVCSRPPWERRGNYRAGRLCALTPRTCLKDGSNRRACRSTIRLTHSGATGITNFLENERHS